MIKALFFDLDGTLLPISEKEFADRFIELLYKKIKSLDVNPDKFIAGMQRGLFAMFKNDGQLRNDVVFYQAFNEKYPDISIEMINSIMNDFYENEFYQLNDVAKENKYAREIIDTARSLVQYVMLTTNPFFPITAIRNRMKFIGLKEEDFDYITTYDNSYYCKPNPLYFIKIMEMYHLSPEEVLVIGNNEREDFYCASKAGIRCILIGNNIEKYPELAVKYENYDYQDVANLLRRMCK